MLFRSVSSSTPSKSITTDGLGPLTPALKGELASSAYIAEMTDEMRQQQRDEILATTQEDIRALADLVDACMKENAICVLGGSNKVNEAKDVFKTVTTIL